MQQHQKSVPGESAPLLTAVEVMLSRYVTFASDDYRFACALWTVGTFLWESSFDAYPYLVITADTKRSGKTRLAEVMSFMSHNGRMMTAVTPAALMRIIRDEKATVFIDEAESMSSESTSVMRQLMNVGYRRGQTISRVNPGRDAGVSDWPV